MSYCYNITQYTNDPDTQYVKPDYKPDTQCVKITRTAVNTLGFSPCVSSYIFTGTTQEIQNHLNQQQSISLININVTPLDSLGVKKCNCDCNCHR